MKLLPDQQTLQQPSAVSLLLVISNRMSLPTQHDNCCQAVALEKQLLQQQFVPWMLQQIKLGMLNLGRQSAAL
jgi:hypothetical protein